MQTCRPTRNRFRVSASRWNSLQLTKVQLRRPYTLPTHSPPLTIPLLHGNQCLRLSHCCRLYCCVGVPSIRPHRVSPHPPPCVSDPTISRPFTFPRSATKSQTDSAHFIRTIYSRDMASAAQTGSDFSRTSVWRHVSRTRDSVRSGRMRPSHPHSSIVSFPLTPSARFTTGISHGVRWGTSVHLSRYGMSVRLSGARSE